MPPKRKAKIDNHSTSNKSRKTTSNKYKTKTNSETSVEPKKSKNTADTTNKRKKYGKLCLSNCKFKIKENFYHEYYDYYINTHTFITKINPISSQVKWKGHIHIIQK